MARLAAARPRGAAVAQGRAPVGSGPVGVSLARPERAAAPKAWGRYRGSGPSLIAAGMARRQAWKGLEIVPRPFLLVLGGDRPDWLHQGTLDKIAAYGAWPAGIEVGPGHMGQRAQHP